jgi:hypothetical protein
MKRRRLAILLVVMLAVFLSLGWALWRQTNGGSHNGPSPGLLSLADTLSFSADRHAGARAVADAVSRSGERPEEFLAEVEVSGANGMLVFHLWHRSAWKPENRGAVGNPGGKCRDVYFDLRRGEVTHTLFWQ